MLIYKKQTMSLDELSRILQYLLLANYVDVIAGDLNHDFSNVSLNKLLELKIGYTKLKNEPT